MAQLNVETKKREVITKTVVEEKEYILKMSPNELKFLLCVLNRIGGSPKHSPRKHAESLSAAIAKIYTCHTTYDEDMVERDVAIMYKDNTLEAFDKDVQ